MRTFKTIAKVMILVILGYLFAVLQPSQAQNEILRFGYINSAFIFDGYKGKEALESQYNKELLVWQEEVKLKEEGIKKLQKELNDCLMCTDARKKALQNQIDEEAAKAQQFYLDKFGYGGEAAQLETQMTSPILMEIQEVLSDIGGSEGYTMIFDGATGQLVYAPEDLNMSQQVLDILNSRPVKKSK